MTSLELSDRMADEFRKLDWRRPLTIEELKSLNNLWHELMYQAKGDVCDHPERERWQGHCFKCGRNVEVEQVSK